MLYKVSRHVTHEAGLWNTNSTKLLLNSRSTKADNLKMLVVSYFVLKQVWTNFFLKGHNRHCGDGLRAARAQITIHGIPNILNYCRIFCGVCVCVCTHTYIYKIYIRGRGTHNNLVSRMRPAGRGLLIHILKVCHFTSSPKTLRSRINYKIFPVLFLNTDHGSRIFLRNPANL